MIAAGSCDRSASIWTMHVVARARCRCAKPARYAVPSPAFSLRTSTSMWPSSSLSACAELGRAVGTVVVDDEHVDVGRGGADAWQELGMLPASSYVGMTTSVRMTQRRLTCRSQR